MNSGEITPEEDEDAQLPPHHLVPTSWWVSGLTISSVICIVVMWLLVDIPVWETFLGIMLAFLVSILAVRALGETDFNPVSGVGKLSQLVFAGVSPGSLISNLVAGAVAEAGAAQAGDLMQDLKTVIAVFFFSARTFCQLKTLTQIYLLPIWGHLVRASPRAQFYAQLIGSGFSSRLLSFTRIPFSLLFYFDISVQNISLLPVSSEILLIKKYAFHTVFTSALAYRLYSGAYTIPSPTLPAPTSALWLSMAKLVTGNAGALTPVIPFAVLAVFLGIGLALGNEQSRIKKYLPSGVAFAISFYLTPNFVIPRVVGAFVQYYWQRKNSSSHDIYMIIVASGFVLGEGVVSIINAIQQSAGVGPVSCFGCVENHCPNSCFE